MTVRVVDYTLKGRLRIREADDDAHAADVAEAAITRAAEPFTRYGAEVESDAFHYTRESIITVDG